jgi:hypothetical protein
MRDYQLGEFQVIKKYVFIAVVALIALLAACGASAITGSGVLITEIRDVSEFSGVEASSISTVTFVPGTEPGVVIEADNNLISLLEARVENGVLHLGPKTGTLIISGTIRYTVTYVALDSIVLSGSATGEAAALNEDDLSITLSGSSTLTLMGQVSTLNLTESGSSTLNAFLLTAQQVSTTMSATSSAQVTIEDALTATLSGSASLVYRGDATNIQQVVSGSATIQKAQ